MAEGESLRFPALQKSVNQCIEEQENKHFLSEFIVTVKRENGVAKTRVRVPIVRVPPRVRDCYYKKKQGKCN